MSTPMRPAASCTSRAREIPAALPLYNLDTLASLGEIPNANARGVAVSANPVMDSPAPSRSPCSIKTLALIKTIDVDGGPDGIMYDPFNDRVWILSHRAPNATVINAADGSIAGTVDLGGAPEQAASDGKGKIYVDIEDKANVAVVDAKTLTDSLGITISVRKARSAPDSRWM